jgi:hypothetical protein
MFMFFMGFILPKRLSPPRDGNNPRSMTAPGTKHAPRRIFFGDKETPRNNSSSKTVHSPKRITSRSRHGPQGVLLP